jgi:hypothetical protein
MKNDVNREGAHLDTATSGENEWRSAGLRHGALARAQTRGAVPEAGVPVAVSRCAHREEQILEAALRFSTLEQQAAFVKGACGNDVKPRQSVEALLKTHDLARVVVLEPNNREACHFLAPLLVQSNID